MEGFAKRILNTNDMLEQEIWKSHSRKRKKTDGSNDNDVDDRAKDLLDEDSDSCSSLRPFQQWLAQNQSEGSGSTLSNNRTSLKQELALAKQLFDESKMGRQPDDDDLQFGEFMEVLTATPLTHDIVSWKGISVDWILECFCQKPFVKQWKDFGCELWFVRKVCIIEMMRRQYKLHHCYGSFVDSLEKISPGLVRKPTVFLSYTGRYNWGDFANVLESLRGEYVWIDIFCVDQFAWTGRGRTVEMKEVRERLLNHLPTQISSIGTTVLILEQWSDVMLTLKQIWVLWEIYNTVQVKAQFKVLLSNHEIQHYLTDVETGGEDFDAIRTMLEQIDCMNANAEDPADGELIRSLMTKEGSYQVDCQVSKQIRLWLIDTGRASLQQRGRKSWSFVNNFVTILSDQGLLEEAELLQTNQLAESRQRNGDDHPDTLVAMYNLADLRRKRGEIPEAEMLHTEVLSSRRHVLGNVHLDTLASIDALANLLCEKGEYTMAESLSREALAGRQKKLGEDHPDTLMSLNNLACILSEQGKFSEAQALYKTVVTDSLKPEYVSNFGHSLSDQGKFSEAETIHRMALQKFRQQLGDTHPDTLSEICNMAAVLHVCGRLSEAEVLHREALRGFRNLFGNLHPDTLTSMDSLAEVLQSLGRLEEAEVLCREALSARRSVLSEDHLDTLDSLHNLASLFSDKEQHAVAEKMGREVLNGRRKQLGSEHPKTLRSIENLAIYLSDQGKLEEAEPLFREALRGRLKLLGGEHPDSLFTMSNLADLLADRGRLVESKELFSKALRGLETQLGNDHPGTARVREGFESLKRKIKDHMRGQASSTKEANDNC